MSTLMDNQTHHVPHKSWNELEWNDTKVESGPKKMSWLKGKTVAISLSLLTALSSCTDKTVDEQVRDIIGAKQEKVDDLKDDKRDLQEDIRKKDIELKDAEKQLREAKKLKHK